MAYLIRSLAATALILSLSVSAVAADRSGAGTAVQNETGRPLPGDLNRLERELNYRSSIRYRILVVEDSGSMDKTDYLDQVAAKWGEPAPDTLLLIIFARDNHDIRFYMGANLTRQGATIDSMLRTLRANYFPLSQKGDVADGLARFIAAVSDQYSESMQFPAVDPRVPANVRQALAGWANRYLTPYLAADQPDKLRAASVRLDELGVVESDEGIVYKVVYSVKPAVETGSDWVAGSGTPEPTGWVSGKVKLIRVTEENGELRLSDWLP